MNSAVMAEMDTHVDPIEEMRLRTWARQHYLPAEERDPALHPVILDEMHKRDVEDSRRG